MILKAIVEDQEYSLNVPDASWPAARSFCAKLDRTWTAAGR
jgi:hypothetical protein